jgi:hypothetical protein
MGAPRLKIKGITEGSERGSNSGNMDQLREVMDAEIDISDVIQ